MPTLLKIPFLSKRPRVPDPWNLAGFQSEAEWQLWNPHICGIYCLKMLIDGVTASTNTLASLTVRCCELGGFRNENGRIQGVFHKPLLQLAKELGFEGNIEGHLSTDLIIQSIKQHRFVLLSIKLDRVTATLSGSHLILIHSYRKTASKFTFHDCSEVLGVPGANLTIDNISLNSISNKKGLILWQQQLLTGGAARRAATPNWAV